MRSGGLFAGYGGLDMAVAEVFGAEPAWFSEIDDAPSKILAHRWPDVPNLGDITQIDWDTVEPIDILTGGFPCQDVSAAGKRAGLHPDTRSGLWNHMAYAIAKLRPRYVVAENVRGLLSAEAHSDVEPCPWCVGDGSGEHSLRALGAVLGDLGELGYDTEWCGLRAAAVGAPHGRFRIFILAVDAAGSGLQGQAGGRIQHGLPGAGCGRPAFRRSATAQLAGATAAYTERGRWDGWTPHQVGEQVGRTPPTWGRLNPATDPDGDGLALFRGQQPVERDTHGCGGADIAWHDYEPAIRRWEAILGRPAPAPTELSTKGSRRLSPAFVEWMMGLPDRHVTGVPGLSRNEQLKALGNGVVPQQAIAALRHMTRSEVAS